MPPGKPLLSQRSGEAHCLENAYTDAIFFTVKHCRHLRNGQIFLTQSVCMTHLFLGAGATSERDLSGGPRGVLVAQSFSLSPRAFLTYL